MHKPIDVRSDTVTRPSIAMKTAMLEAELGDDVYEDDPTVNLLQARAAELTGKEAALFVPSGTMSNAIALRCHTTPGNEVLLDGEAHSMLYEVGLPAVIAQVLTRQFHSDQGVPDVEEIEQAIHLETLHNPGTRLLILENTHNRAGGTVIPLEVMQHLYKLCQTHGLSLHLDGARIFNAAVATNIPVSEYAKCTDTLTFCLSKGLGCPVGSLLCGSASWINRARRVRKMLGGGMRQVGMLAAAGLYALEHNVDRLADDHRRAAHIAQSMEGLKSTVPDTFHPPTNMVYINTTEPASNVSQQLAQRGILCNPTGSHRLRIVTHLDVDDTDTTHIISVLREID